METVYIKTPLGIAAITGDVHGVSEITVLEGVKYLLKSRFFYKRQCSNFKNISIRKELILPLNSIKRN
jgi:hypothetical protein